MGRKIKSGLNYFPMDVDFCDDIKIRRLIKRQGGRAVAVYALVLCFIYKSGYYIGADQELPFVLSEKLGFDEAYIQQVLSNCLSLGLLSAEMYNRYNVYTSAAIQERYMDICAQMKRKSVIREYNLLDEESEEAHDTQESSEQTYISSEETKVTSEETSENSVFSTQNKIKEKEKKNKKEINKKKDFGLSSEISVDDIQRELMSNETWKETILMNRRASGYPLTANQLDQFIQAFCGALRERMVATVPTLRDAAEHFSNWLTIQLRINNNEKRNNNKQQPGSVQNAAEGYCAGIVSAPQTITL